MRRNCDLPAVSPLSMFRRRSEKENEEDERESMPADSVEKRKQPASTAVESAEGEGPAGRGAGVPLPGWDRGERQQLTGERKEEGRRRTSLSSSTGEGRKARRANRQEHLSRSGLVDGIEARRPTA